MIALIFGSYKDLQSYMRCKDGILESYNPQTYHGRFKDGREFIAVWQHEHLMNIEISDFIIADRTPEYNEMIKWAVTRVRL